MPTIFYVISDFIPASYYINIARGIILHGAGLSHQLSRILSTLVAFVEVIALLGTE
ncbi:MAG TPA: hypothetical protein VN879_00095 [Candidatus Acidoferrales bacterium]|nr:hypothetical protein [Candidatus Acidoferrales bacterium]